MQRTAEGQPLFDVTTRDRDPLNRPDSVLSTLDRSDFHEMWLFAVDIGNGLTEADSRAISNFRRLGRGLMLTRDHMDLGCSICAIEEVGAAHHFHSKNVDPSSPAERDDPYTTDISWPNHSGANGDYQIIQAKGPVHPVLSNPSSPSGAVRYLPSHPHEGAVSAPSDTDARVIATATKQGDRQIIQYRSGVRVRRRSRPRYRSEHVSSFRGLQLDTRLGAPSFVVEPPGDAIMREPAAMAETHRYVRNVALWLGGTDPSLQRTH